jgi:ribosomal protein L18
METLTWLASCSFGDRVAISERERAGNRLVLDRGCAAGGSRVAEVAGGASDRGEVLW